VLVQFLYPVFESCHLALVDPEYIEKRHQEGFGVGIFVKSIIPLVGEFYSAVFNLVPA
jgi:hypothetical protein